MHTINEVYITFVIQVGIYTCHQVFSICLLLAHTHIQKALYYFISQMCIFVLVSKLPHKCLLLVHMCACMFSGIYNTFVIQVRYLVIQQHT